MMDCTAPRHTQNKKHASPLSARTRSEIRLLLLLSRNMTYGHPQESRRQLWQPMAADLLAAAPLDLGRGRRPGGRDVAFRSGEDRQNDPAELVAGSPPGGRTASGEDGTARPNHPVLRGKRPAVGSPPAASELRLPARIPPADGPQSQPGALAALYRPSARPASGLLRFAGNRHRHEFPAG